MDPSKNPKPDPSRRDWLQSIFPRNQQHVTLARKIMHKIDEQGYLPAWGWHRSLEADSYTRSARTSTINTLLRHGCIEPRHALLGDREKRVYVRSTRIVEQAESRIEELAQYQIKHRWWTPKGRLAIPNRKRAEEHADTEDDPRRTVESVQPATNSDEMTVLPCKEAESLPRIEGLKSAVLPGSRYPGYNGQKDEKNDVLGELASLLKVSIEEAMMYATQLATDYEKKMRLTITPVQAAQAYLRYKNWEFQLWNLDG